MNEDNPEFQIHSQLSEAKKAALTAVVSQLLENKTNPIARPAASKHSAWASTFQARKPPKSRK